MTADTEEDLEALRAIGHVCAETLRKMMQAVRPGMTTRELDDCGRELLEISGARSAPELAYDYPGATCISVCPVIAHGIPGEHVLEEGELMHIDVSAEMNGYYGDTGASMCVPDATGAESKLARPEVRELLEATRATLDKALHAARAGRPLNGIGSTVEREAKRHGYHIIYELTGHGIGHSLHESPREIWNFHNPRDRRLLKPGMVLAIEPFLTLGRGGIHEAGDGWSLNTADNAPAAQFEHTIVVTHGQPLIVTM
jgi:methionyl aminopeptidase